MDVFIWGYADRGQQIKAILSKYNFKITGFIDNKIHNKNCISFYEFLGNYTIDKCTIFLGTVWHETEIEMIRSIREFSEKAIIVDRYEFHHKFERPYYIEENKNLGYHINLISQFKLWLNHIQDEIEFWKKEVVDEAGVYHKGYVDHRIVKKKFFCDRLENFKISDGAIILDIGCGVCTQYGKILECGSVNLIGIDPLADAYNKLNIEFSQKKGTALPPKVQFGFFEFMHYFKKNKECDVILIDNALDHCIDPVQAILSCFYILKIGGCLSLCHSVDEALHANYTGLHQWNLTSSDKSEFIIWNNNHFYNVTHTLEKYAEIETYIKRTKNESYVFGSIICNIVKKREIPFEWLKKNIEAGKIMECLMEKVLMEIELE